MAIILMTITACHTYAWQPVEEEIQGDWTFMPVEPGNTQRWVIENGEIRVFVNNAQILFNDGNGGLVDHLDYTIQNSFTNHYMDIQYLTTATSGVDLRFREEIERWLIVKLNDTELYISSEAGYRIGNEQRHFFRF